MKWIILVAVAVIFVAVELVEDARENAAIRDPRWKP